jgi:hypothetical protein
MASTERRITQRIGRVALSLQRSSLSFCPERPWRKRDGTPDHVGLEVIVVAVGGEDDVSSGGRKIDRNRRFYLCGGRNPKRTLASSASWSRPDG